MNRVNSVDDLGHDIFSMISSAVFSGSSAHFRLFAGGEDLKPWRIPHPFL